MPEYCQEECAGQSLSKEVDTNSSRLLYVSARTDVSDQACSTRKQIHFGMHVHTSKMHGAL